MWQCMTLGLLVVLSSCGSHPLHQHLVYVSPRIQQPASLVLLPTTGSHGAANVQQYSSPGAQYVFVGPPGVQAGAPVLYAEGSENPDGGGSTNPFGSFFNYVVSLITTPTEPPVEAAEVTEKPDAAAAEPAKPDRLVSNSMGLAPSGQTANLEKFDEDDKPMAVAPPLIPGQQKFVLVGQPQFFGNYDAINNPNIQRLGSNGVVSSFLLFNNRQPLVQQEPFSKSYVPGKAAIEFQKLLTSGAHSGAATRAQDSITVDAVRSRPRGDEEDSTAAEDSENVEAGQAGPSVAQVKPQAIALAGPGGVAAAAPIGTALVGPGGLAVAAPSATAVAGPSGGAPPIVAPANTASLSSPEAFKAYLLAQVNSGRQGDYHVSYNI